MNRSLNGSDAPNPNDDIDMTAPGAVANRFNRNPMSAAPQAERPPRGGADPLSVVGGMIRAMTTPAAVIVDATAYAQ
ncbi:hypothetical protein ACN6LL_004838, partial [Streptomyces violaceoruber]